KNAADADKEKVTIIPQRRVEAYKNSHPDWRQDPDLRKVGKAFDVDYIIYLEVNSLSMYEQGSFNQLYRGRANLTVTLINVKDAAAPAVAQEPSVCVYPSEARGSMAADFEMPPVRFRQVFLDRIAKELSWKFTKHQRREAAFMD